MSAIQNKINQTNRLIGFYCQQIPDPIAYEVSGIETLSEAFQFTIKCTSTSPLKLSTCLHQKAHLVLGPHGRHIHGQIIFIKALHSHSILYHDYELQIAPDLTYLQHNIDSRIFQGKTVLDIVDLICQEHNLHLPCKQYLQSSYPAIAYCTQYQESSYDFIQRILNNAGIHYYFEHLENDYQWILFDTPQHGSNHSTELSFKDQVNPSQYYISRWQQQHRLQSAVIKLKNYHYLSPNNPITAIAKNHHQTKLTALSHYQFPSQFQAIKVGNHTAEQLAGHLNWRNQLCQAATNCPTLKLHQHVSINLNNQKTQFMITSLSHTVTDHSGLSDHAVAQHYENIIGLLPVNLALSTPLVPKPQANGPLTAIVIGLSNNTTHTDSLARVKVFFHWDRYHHSTSVSHCWLRCSQTAAGQQWGSLWIPRVGDEVLVDFTNGNIDEPIVIGSSYNANNPPLINPMKTPYKSAITTRTIGSANQANSHAIQFNDQSSHPQLQIQSSKDFEHITWHNRQTTVHQDSHTVIDSGNFHVITTAKHSINAQQGITLRSGNSGFQIKPTGISINANCISINPAPSKPIHHAWWSDLFHLFYQVKNIINTVEDVIEAEPLLATIASAINDYLDLRQLIDIGNMALGAVEMVGGIPLDEIGLGELMQEDAIKREIISGSDLAESYAARTAEKEAGAGVKLSESRPPTQPPDKELEEMEKNKAKNGHFYSRHGAHLTDEDIKKRATTGQLPDKNIKRDPVDASRYYQHDFQKYAIKRAKEDFAKTGRRNQIIKHINVIGGGYLQGGEKYVDTKISRVILNNKGEVITAFPLINP